MRKLIIKILLPIFLLSLLYCEGQSNVQTINGKKYYDFSNYYHSGAKSVFFPKNFQDVQKIVNQSIENKKSIAVAGTQLSQGGHTLPSTQNDYLIFTKFLNQISILPDEKIAIVGPGASWRDVQKAANDYNLAVKVMQASNVFSVGGSLSTNVHGWDHQEGTLAESVLSLTIVNSSGTIQKVYPGDELFSLLLGGYGMFGVIVEAEISLSDNIVLERKGIKMPTQDYLDYFKANIENEPSIALHYARLSLDPNKLFEEIISVNYSVSEGENRSPKNLQEEPSNGHWYERLAVNYLRKYPYLIKLKQYYDDQTFLKPKLMTRNEAMSPPVRFVYDSNKENGDMLQEFFVPYENLYPFLEELKALIQNYDVSVFNATLRHVKQDDLTTLSYAKTDVVAIVIFYNESLDIERMNQIKEFSTSAIDAAIQFQGTYYLPYHRFSSIEQLLEAYPTYSYVLEKKQELDPNNVFLSQFSKHYFNRGSE